MPWRRKSVWTTTICNLSSLFAQTRVHLVYFDIGENLSNEHGGSSGGDHSTEERDQENKKELPVTTLPEPHRLAEEVGRLHEPVHLRLAAVEIDAVKEEVDADGGAAEEGGPSPVVVFGVEEDVGSDDADAGLDDDEDEDHGGQEAVHVVVLVRPQRREQEEYLDEDRAERNQTAHQRDEPRGRVERRARHRRRNRGDAARVVRIPAEVAAEDGSRQLERESDEEEENQEETEGFPRE